MMTDPLMPQGTWILNGTPVVDVDLVVNRSLSLTALLLQKTGFQESVFHRISLTAGPVISADLEGTVVKGVDPVSAEMSGVFAAATRLAKHRGALYVWPYTADAAFRQDFNGRPVEDVDIVAHPNKWLLLPVQGASGRLVQLNPANMEMRETTLTGFIQSGVDAVVTDSGQIFIPTIDPNALGSYLDHIEPISGSVLRTIELPGLLVPDQDLVMRGERGLIALESFDGTVGFLAMVDLNTATVDIICLPGRPVPGVDPIFIESKNKAVLAISNRYGNFDRVAVVDLGTRTAQTIDLPERVRADVDVVVDRDENFVVAASEAHLTRIRLSDNREESFPLPGRVPTATDLLRIDDGLKVMIPVGTNALMGKGVLVTFDIATGVLTQESLPGHITPGIDLLPVQGPGAAAFDVRSPQRLSNCS
jgi:hypothetical protein